MSLVLHPRVNMITKFENDLRMAIVSVKPEGTLTYLEWVQAYHNVLSSEIRMIVKQGIRMERHNDPDKPGDEE